MLTAAIASTLVGLPGALGWQDKLPPTSLVSMDSLIGVLALIL